MVAHEARQREYAARGQKHFYFMTLNGNEVVIIYRFYFRSRFCKKGHIPLNVASWNLAHSRVHAAHHHSHANAASELFLGKRNAASDI